MNPGVPQLHPGDPDRLRGQVSRLGAFYVGHPRDWFSLAELVRAIGATSEAGISARLRDLRKAGWQVLKRKRRGNLWEYQASAPSVSLQLEIL